MIGATDLFHQYMYIMTSVCFAALRNTEYKYAIDSRFCLCLQHIGPHKLGNHRPIPSLKPKLVKNGLTFQRDTQVAGAKRRGHEDVVPDHALHLDTEQAHLVLLDKQIMSNVWFRIFERNRTLAKQLGLGFPFCKIGARAYRQLRGTPSTGIS